MAVLVEAISVIVRCAAIEEKFAGGLKAFVDFCREANNTFCADGELARIGFVEPEHARRFVEKLGFLGLAHMRNGRAQDLVVADQRGGILNPCDWSDFGLADLPGDPPPHVAACRLKGTRIAAVAVPEGWRYDTSISKQAGTTPKAKVPLAVYAKRPGVQPPPLAQVLGLRPVKR